MLIFEFTPRSQLIKPFFHLDISEGSHSLFSHEKPVSSKTERKLLIPILLEFNEALLDFIEGKLWTLKLELRDKPAMYAQMRVTVPSYVYEILTKPSPFITSLELKDITPFQKHIIDVFYNVYSNAPLLLNSIIFNKRPSSFLYSSLNVRFEAYFNEIFQNMVSAANEIYKLMHGDNDLIAEHFNILESELSNRRSMAKVLIKKFEKFDDFPIHLDSTCDAAYSDSVNTPFFVKYIQSPRFNSLYPSRIYTSLDIARFKFISGILTLCDIRKRALHFQSAIMEKEVILDFIKH